MEQYTVCIGVYQNLSIIKNVAIYFLIWLYFDLLYLLFIHPNNVNTINQRFKEGEINHVVLCFFLRRDRYTTNEFERVPCNESRADKREIQSYVTRYNSKMGSLVTHYS